MRTIWKFPIGLIQQQKISMPRGAVIRHVANNPIQGGGCLWAEVDTDAPLEPRMILIFGTGGQQFVASDPDYPILGPRYIGTFMTGSLVWHVYEVPRGT